MMPAPTRTGCPVIFSTAAHSIYSFHSLHRILNEPRAALCGLWNVLKISVVYPMRRACSPISDPPVIHRRLLQKPANLRLNNIASIRAIPRKNISSPPAIFANRLK
jgi:hypothetical protein